MESGIKFVNEYLKSCNREIISSVQYNDLLEDLRDIGCIVLENGNIRLIEKIHIKY